MKFEQYAKSLLKGINEDYSEENAKKIKGLNCYRGLICETDYAETFIMN